MWPIRHVYFIQIFYCRFGSDLFHQDQRSSDLNCGGACSARCRLSSRPHLCKRACGTCCQRCSCVPPGTAGNLETCPCYATLTTHGGRRKCP
ncbi:gibberellin-regulated protein 1-like [Pyrus ussuriensis x Pyrus communis]|uniref:Gibberellin-regulated protein 1-like n=1 Tax=Pyrus ussuriensis x Pyrus communis TaxID=2448454 RepID=A0A5N5HPT1_9ROSA|nr:gibberellin-regulated protein 1-like [Pyrus ussuriensis x Pyrus communis]